MNIIKKSLLVTIVASLLFSLFVISGSNVFCTLAYAAGEREGLDEGMTKRVQEDGDVSALPLMKWWSVDLKRVDDQGNVLSNGKVYSQPIIVKDQNAIYVQAGRDFIKLSGYQEATKDNPPAGMRLTDINNHEWPSGSTPTYAMTQFGPRIYAATRDHRLYALDPVTLRSLWNEAMVLSAGNKPEYRYRIMTGPMIKEVDQKTIISLGTASGDLTGLESNKQYADNGFFILEDQGNTSNIIKMRRMNGELTSSHVYVDANGSKKILGLENTLNSETKIAHFILNDDLSDASLIRDGQSFNGVSSSPSFEMDDSGNQYLYFSDREGIVYRYDITKNKLDWWNGTAKGSSRALEGIAIGDKYVYASIRHFHTQSTGGNGAILVLNKENGRLVKTINLKGSIKNNVLYWRPYEDKPGYVIIQSADGSIQFVEDDTWVNVKWFQDEKGVLHDTYNLTGTMDQHNAPELVFADNLLLTVDGDGVMHAYKSVRPNNLAITEFKAAGDKKLEDYSPGEMIALTGTFENTSEKGFTDVVIELKDANGKVLHSIKRDMDARSKFTEQFEVLNEAGLPYFELYINEKRDNPPDEVNWDDNKAVLMLPVDIRIDDFKLNKQLVSEKDRDVVAQVKVYLEPLFESKQKFSLKTKVKLTIAGRSFEKDITLHSKEQQAVSIPFSVTDEELKSGVVPVLATVNEKFEIYEPLSPESIRKNNFAGPIALIAEGDADLIALSLTAPGSAIVGSPVTISASVQNKFDEPQKNVLIRFYANDKMIYEMRTDFKANQTKDVGGFIWRPDSPGYVNLSVHVDPLKEAKDNNRSNNVITKGIEILPIDKGDPACRDAKPDGSWKVTYWIITGYPTKTKTYTYVDEDGKTKEGSYSYVDYSDPIWEPRQVTYTEQLRQESKVNTKQGIATDRKNPKESDRESRGSWEIIPWASKNGYDPNEVTRAGYGFELEVKTAYTTNYETKVPKGLEGTARPIGGRPTGPTEVIAKIYDTNGKYVEKISLEKTKGDDRTATWELPIVSFTASTGEVFNERKFYTDVKAPDGKYTIQIFAKNAGQTGLSYCETKEVVIYGSMYDDTQNIRQ